MKRWLFLLFLFILLPASVLYAQKTITGTVIDEEKEPLIGVSVAIKGTTTGTVTDLDGKYSINVPEGSNLTFEYLGMQPKTVKVTSTTSILDVTLQAESQVIDEVVVTAMGVKAEKRRLNFAVQSVNSEDLMASRPQNFVEALQGKVAGVNITSQGGSPNAGTSMVIRAISSINPSQSNEPLFVIDGMNMAAGSGGMAQLNPNDIENVTVLKGAAASALYGAAGANGVVMVTTKSAQKGKVSVNFSKSIQWDNVSRLPETQNKWMPGGGGFLSKSFAMNGWGPEIAPGTKTYNNIKNFFQTGFLDKYDVSVSAGGEKSSVFGSVNYSSQEGVVPNDYLDKMGMYLKANIDVSPTLSMSFMANIYTSKFRDATASNAESYPSYLEQAYNWPIIDDMRNYKTPNGRPSWLYDRLFYTKDRVPDELSKQRESSKSDWKVNPYWARNEDYQKRESTNNIAQVSATWKAFKNFNVTGRLGYEFGSSGLTAYTIPRFFREDFDNPDAELKGKTELFGTYNIRSTRSNNYTANIMARYTYDLNDDFNFEFMAGSEFRITKSTTDLLGGNEFDIPNFYSIRNIVNYTTGINKDMDGYLTRTRKVGMFGEIRMDYKGIASLSVTGRNDMASTLLNYNGDSKYSYFYPSVTGGVTFTELFKISNDIFTFGKLRANWAKVGKDPNGAYLFSKKYSQKPKFPDGGYGTEPTVSIARDLKPEMSKTWEVGLDLRFFKNKTRLDVAYYQTSTDDQIVTVRTSPAAGTILQTMNQGEVENKGIEITLDQDIIKNKDFSWTANINFAHNRGKVVSLPEQLSFISNTNGRVGAIILPAAYLHKSTTAVIGRDYERNSKGQIICNADGTPKVSAATDMLIGDREPDFRMGFGSNFRYKDLSLSFLFDIRKGGDVVNGVAMSLYSSGMHKRMEKFRNKEVLFKGVVQQADGTYKPNTTPIIMDAKNFGTYFTDVSSNFIEEASFVRLSHVTVGYNFKKLIKGQTIVKDLNLAVTGRNLFLLTNYSGADPQVNFDGSGGTGTMGIDKFSVPNTRSFNITVNATF